MGFGGVIDGFYPEGWENTLKKKKFHGGRRGVFLTSPLMFCNLLG